jgi:hypothetical protein
MTSEVAAIVRVARGTIDGEKFVFVNTENARHVREGFGRRARAQDFTVIEDDAANRPRRSEARIAFISH